jgi:glycine/D-amino acid oxidase-like deaminating enzyme
LEKNRKIEVDVLVIGQGLAGTLLTHFLQQAGKSVHVIDDNYPRAATKVAAGIINPVTGRRYVKSWSIDKLLPFARETYQQLERQLDVSIYHPQQVLRALFNQREENDWQIRAYDPAYQAYIRPGEIVDTGNYSHYTHPAFAYGEVHGGARVDIGKLVGRYRSYLAETGRITTEFFDHAALRITGEGIQYQMITARTLVFCEGAKAKTNPYFSDLPYEGNKGEAVIVNIPEAGFRKILKQGIFIVPLQENRYWVGSTSNNHHTDDLPSQEGRSYLVEKLSELLSTDFEIVSHEAAIRPTIKDRRPLLGRHPEYPQLYLFTGLGTKGTSLGPYWADQLVKVMFSEQKMDPAVDIDRFQRKTSK